MNVAARGDAAACERHQILDLVGLRPHATAVGLIQLCEKLLNASILSAEDLDRIKSAICSKLAVGKRARVSDRFDDVLKQRIDAIFPVAPGEPAHDPIGSLEEFEDALGGYHGA